MDENCIEFMYKKRKMMTGVGNYVHTKKRWAICLGEEKAEGRQN